MKTFSLILFSLIGLIACDKDIDYLSQHPVNIAQDKTIDEHVEFLLNAAKTDFLKGQQKDLQQLRDVRLGYITNKEGKEQYFICGQFLANEPDKNSWVQFITIKTIGYEQWLGIQAKGLCNREETVWLESENLSALLLDKLITAKQ